MDSLDEGLSSSLQLQQVPVKPNVCLKSYVFNYLTSVNMQSRTRVQVARMRLNVKSTAFNRSLADLIVSMIYGQTVTSQSPFYCEPAVKS